MASTDSQKKHTLSIIVPCYNESSTLKHCIERLIAIEDDLLKLEIIIVDDASRDDSRAIAIELSKIYPQIVTSEHSINQGKGAALHTGFQKASGDFVAIQDADLEYDPNELKILIAPLIDDTADVVFGSRYLSGKSHRVLYFWHTLGNKFLTLLSNMFTDLDLTDMETCYKVFRREIIQQIDLKEKRFGFEPEIVAKIAQMNVRIFEIGVSYYGRTYEEGKKIGLRDGFRALYCIFRYSSHVAPLPIQFLIYLFIGGSSGLFNMFVFLGLGAFSTFETTKSAAIAYVVSAILNYLLCIIILFRHNARWNSLLEILIYAVIVVLGGVIDVTCVTLMIGAGFSDVFSKAVASLILILVNFWFRRSIVFPEKIRYKRP